jgi:hypothetical protein
MRAWPWAVAAAAMLALTVLLQSGAAAARDRVKTTTTTAAPDLEAELVEALRETGHFSDSEARLMAMAQQVQMRIEQNRPGAERSER